ncbi:hypothetical protein [Hyphomicrobium sp.]|uniref:hypothetical protein n=1 Tax=Hyphomicrobium sp. TaxID=82 RepID=UPI002E369BB1|nr:hypothetical protein [Hyphomicrobium sp.]HEX2841373.1 hypothetical protein [Hyphomicrobium sp.]
MISDEHQRGPKPVVGPALDVDATPAFLFESDDGHFLGVSLRPSGDDLPRDRRWARRSEFALGVHEAVPAAIDPEPLLRGIKANGYFVWATNRTRPFGTAQ